MINGYVTILNIKWKLAYTAIYEYMIIQIILINYYISIWYFKSFKQKF